MARIAYWTYCSISNSQNVVKLVESARAAGVVETIYVLTESENSVHSIVGIEVIVVSGVELLECGAKLPVCIKTAFTNARVEFLVYLSPEILFVSNPDFISATFGCGAVFFLKEYFIFEDGIPNKYKHSLLFNKYRIYNVNLIPAAPRIFMIQTRAIDAVFSITQEVFAELEIVGAPKDWRLVAFLIEHVFTTGLTDEKAQNTLIQHFRFPDTSNTTFRQIATIYPR